MKVENDLLGTMRLNFGVQIGMISVLKKYLSHMLDYEKAAKMLEDCQSRLESYSADIKELEAKIRRDETL